jgi:hypothetical protein
MSFFPARDGMDLLLKSCNLAAREKPAEMDGLFYKT